MDDPVSEKEVSMAVINGLQTQFDNLISALDALGNEDNAFYLDLVKCSFLQEEQGMASPAEKTLV